MKRTSFLIALVVADPAFAASGPFVSLKNTNFIVLLAFILFIGVLFYFNVPKLLGGMLDKRAETIRSELDEARKLREEAQSILASYERRQKEVQEQADRIVESARKEAEAEAAKARDALEVTVARRLAAAEEQIASAQASAERAVRDKAIKVAVSAARSVIASQMTAASAGKLIDSAISEVEAKLH
ncbi:MAG: F0F1 ATP synthase subunit B [Paracoccaceae bacterium]|jgi:F-type H+-transporting ATPase subunit b|nr:F0F1 ATP synthase subunit B [Paracoccaceae bacterium]MDA0318752.1 F0F1 ATP synthase subunit B [Pseudomonadota bacterium]MDA0849884.1 F0F1 ATP synthase subunit B [Pseudomonadota bacterium]MDA1294818.1 F0F1 ATP synthase subunit B [Pseudomonadota bacterium]